MLLASRLIACLFFLETALWLSKKHANTDYKGITNTCWSRTAPRNHSRSAKTERQKATPMLSWKVWYLSSKSAKDRLRLQLRHMLRQCITQPPSFVFSLFSFLARSESCTRGVNHTGWALHAHTSHQECLESWACVHGLGISATQGAQQPQRLDCSWERQRRFKLWI